MMRKNLTVEEALAIIEDESTEWRLVSHEGEAEAIRQHLQLRDRVNAQLDDAVIRARRRGLT